MVTAHYTPEAWLQLSHYEKADVVAHYRLKRHISLHEAEAADSHAKRLAAKRKK